MEIVFFVFGSKDKSKEQRSGERRKELMVFLISTSNRIRTEPQGCVSWLVNEGTLLPRKEK